MGRKLRVLYCLAYASQANGVVTFVKNYLSEIYKDIEASVVCGDNDLSESFKTFCQDRNIPLFLLPNPYDNGPLKYIKAIREFFKAHHDFDIVHCNIPNYGMFYLKAAKKFGVRVRIMHSHSQEVPHKFISKLIEKIMERLGVQNANVYLACSNEAGRYLFGKKTYCLIPNSIDYKKFEFSENSRLNFRKKYHIPSDSTVFLYLGRLAKQKNPLFSIKVFNLFHKTNDKSFMVFVGDGPLRDELISQAKSLGLSEHIIFTGVVNEVSPYYSMSDYFIAPSFNEGLPLAVIEAQVSGLNVLVSTGIPKEVQICSKFLRLPLNLGEEEWVKKLLEFKSFWDGNRQNEIEHKFDVCINSRFLINLYINNFKEAIK